MTIKPVPLTAEAFAAFGQVLQGSGASTERKPYASRMQNSRPHAKANMTYMRIAPEGRHVRIRELERHPHSNQTFVPLNGTRQLVAVCPSTADGEPVLGGLKVFVADGSQAINYDANVWHAPRMALNAPGEFVMFRWDDGSEGDTEMRDLDPPIDVDLNGI